MLRRHSEVKKSCKNRKNAKTPSNSSDWISTTLGGADKSARFVRSKGCFFLPFFDLSSSSSSATHTARKERVSGS